MSARRKHVYLACPWGSWGGGMYKVADYLATVGPRLRQVPPFHVVDSRGPTLWASPLVVIRALLTILVGRITGHMGLLHVNMAQGLSVFRKGLLIEWAALLGAPVVLHLHAASMPIFYNGLPAPLRLIVRHIFRRAACVVVLGRSAREFVTQRMRIPESRVVMLTNGVPRPAGPRQPRRLQGPAQLLFLGSHFKRKGLPQLLRALGSDHIQRRDWSLTVAGGDDPTEYQALADALGIGARVRFTGWLDEAQASALMAASDCLILPSFNEGLPLVILEAFANGVPVICTPVGEVPNFVTDGHTALFVRPGSHSDIATALDRLLGDELLFRRLSEAGLAVYERQFSFEAFAHALADIYRNYCGLQVIDPENRAISADTLEDEDEPEIASRG